MKTTIGLAVALVALSPPATAGSQGAVSGTAISPDRIPIRYHAVGKGDPALVFVHCAGCEQGFWDGQVAHFAAKHRVVALDLAGHGLSGGGRKDWTMPAFGQDVVSVVEALGLKRVVLIGHSIGGPVVLAIRAINTDLFPTNVEGNRKHVPGYQVAIMKGVGHYPMLEQPEAFNALLAEALRELARSGGRR